MSTESMAENKRPLPRGWQWVQLGKLCNRIDYGFTTSADFNIKAPKFLRITDIQDGKVNWNKVPGCVISEVDEEINRLEEGDIVFARTGATTGKSYLIWNPPRSVFASYLIRVRSRREDVLPEYLFSFFQSDDYWSQILTGARGGAQAGFNATMLSALKILLPPLPDQKRITSILREQLSAVEKARAAAQARLEAIVKLRTAFYRKNFGEVPNVSASPLVPSSPTRPGWSWHRLTDVAKLATGHTPSRYHAEYWDGDIPWIQLADIRQLDGKEAHDTHEHTNSAGIANSAAVLLPKGTVCMSRTATVGFFTIMGRPMATSQDFVNWVCGPKLNPLFLMHLLISCRNMLRELGSGAVHQTIYFPTVKAFSVCIPPISEQTRITELLKGQLAAVDKTQMSAKEELSTINALPAALLRRAFNGEI